MTTAGFPERGQPGLLHDALHMSLPQVAVLRVAAIGDRDKPASYLEADIATACGYMHIRASLAALGNKGYMEELSPRWWRATQDGYRLRDLLCDLGRFEVRTA